MSVASLALALALAASPHGAEGSGPQVSHRKVVARDGVALALYRYAAAGGPSSRRPVLLVPELGFGRELFDLEGQGLARWLALRGVTVYVAELRGQGRADPSTSLQQLVSEDLPAVFEAIARHRPGPVDVVAHGWMGTLVLVSAGHELAGRVGRVVAVNTPATFEPPSALVSEFLAQGGRLASLATSRSGAQSFELMFAMVSDFRPGTLAALRTSGVRDLGEAAAGQLLGWMKEGDLKLADGSTVAGRLRDYDRPTFEVLALADGFANPELCSPLREVSKARVAVRTYSRFFHGQDYAHVSVFLGEKAEAGVFPLIDRFFSVEASP